MSQDLPHSDHPDPNIAYHFEWGFRDEALRRIGEHPVGPNIYPLATEFNLWLQQKGPLSIFAEEHKGQTFSVANPYTYHASAIAGILSKVVNATHAFSTDTIPLDSADAELERLRLYNEQTLYIARFCEALIKQLAYCTQIPKRYYADASLGALLSTECKACKGSGKPRHQISILGSLAHRYHLCMPFEKCLFEHLRIVNRRRNSEAAHSESQSLNIRTVAESRAQLFENSLESGNELVHMLSHIAELERLISNELKIIVFDYKPHLITRSTKT
jgi:hypothetical protein